VFGDGVRGAWLPSGVPVVAMYRFDAGTATPPAGGIAQLATVGRSLKQGQATFVYIVGTKP
jgi:hypothetical protein